MMHSNQGGPFTGVWAFDSQLSRLSTPQPRRWLQHLSCSASSLSVREEIVSASNAQMAVTVEAKLDGNEYPVSGSPIAQTIAYAWLDNHRISGVGRKDGSVSLRETIELSPDNRSLTVNYSILSNGKEVAAGTAIFTKMSA